MKGSIAVPRAMFTSDPLWLEDRPRTQFEAWLDVVQLAQHGGFDHNTKHGVVRLERGEVLLSRRFMAERWGWSEKIVRRWLEKVQEMGRVKAQRKAYDGTVYLIVNYDTYNPALVEKGQEKGQEKGPEMGRERAKRFVEKGPKNDNKEPTITSKGIPAVAGTPTFVPTSTTIEEPSSTSEPPKSPSVGTATTSGGGSLERLPKETTDLCFNTWSKRIGVVNYGRLRKTLLDCVDAGIPQDHLPDAVIAYHEWYDSLSEREKQFNKPSPEKFAVEAPRWARLGQMDYGTMNGPTERGLLITRGAA